MLTIADVSKSYGTRTLFSDVSLFVSRTDRYGLVGPNGAGKSTLFRLILGEESPDEGTLTWERGADYGFLPQETAPAGDETALQLALGHTAAHNVDAAHDHFYDEREPQAKKILAGLGFRERDFDQPARTFSGGWVMRAHIARLLVAEPALLLLDEPTNHLDLAALEWLESFIVSNTDKCVVIVSHDRRLLDRVATTIVAIEPQGHRLRRYGGNYAFYLKRHEIELAKYREEYERQQEEMRALDGTIRQTQHALRYGAKKPPRDNDKFVPHFKGQRAMGAAGRKIRQARERLENLKEEALERPLKEWKIQPTFTTDYYAGDTILSLDSVCKTIAKKTLFAELTAVVARQDRIVLMGPNGAGKTSLLRIIAGTLTPDGGTVKLGLGIKPGYMSQEQETLRLDRTVLEEFRDGLVGHEDELRRDLWHYALLGPKDVDKPVGQLSPGERARLQLAKLVANGANFLLLDEPTNHLDVDSQEQMQSAVEAFEGPIIVVSHDRWFIDHIAQAIWYLSDGVLHRRLGNYSDNSDWIGGLLQGQ